MAIAELERVASLSERILDEVERAVIGKRDVLELVLMGFLADGHVLLEDYPGLAKTLIARSFAQVTDLNFARIHFTPDLMPSDVTGSSIFNQRTGDFEFRPGPIFTNLLLGDEINRAPPKTQWALLEQRIERGADEIRLEAVTDRNGLLEMQHALEHVHVSPAVGYYIVDLVGATRTSQRAQVGAS